MEKSMIAGFVIALREGLEAPPASFSSKAFLFRIDYHFLWK
jgi:hypothetical protein